ncbi:MAG: type 1 glutamine amidotransferase domain-containing protein [Parvibaculum sp.]|uniref:type 1 glutamine amidotransferase domain-containing protein n=1 Tax=Parvibaculum sp. TaxID=2024848 RepID=UPI002ABA9E6C|nr:type 1 glutamine amidotransferase domain-containing protein [Parvibaculum sp.]MDZ4381987.1 type 1 glutamine amidotransferase domain-containing protein [Parvibaculum sp.]
MAKSRVAIVLTSHGKLGDTGKETGFHYEELTTPWYVFADDGVEITLSSIEGGEPPADPSSLPDDEAKRPESVRRFLKDPKAVKALNNTVPVAKLAAKDFDAVYLPGGHGCMWDMPDNDALSRLVSEIYEKGGVVGAVCHGPAGLLGARLSDGTPFVKDRLINSFTDEEERKAEKEGIVPFLLETQLRGLGARFDGGKPFERHACREGRVVTGQNPASAEGVAHGMLMALHALKQQAAE